MQIQPEKIADLIYQQQRNELSAADKELLESWINASSANKALVEEMQNLSVSLPLASLIDRAGKDVLEQVKQQRPELAYHPPVRSLGSWWKYAAIFLLVAGAATLMFLNKQEPAAEVVKAPPSKEEDALPGGDKAILTLADGSTILLDSAGNGTIAQQGTTTISKTADGELIYKGGAGDDAELYNTVSTPKGGQYRIGLPDGTTVWLNAASSISYPTAFRGKERTVRITGEAFFEVAKDAAKPFQVRTNSDLIQVLGTSFNVNSYTDEEGVKTSLIDGAVKIGNIVLKPGQACVKGKVFKTNLDQDVAWKNGVFNFHDVDLAVVMRQLSRWYDVEVTYPQGVPTKRVKGEMGRNLNLSEVMQVLKDIGITTELKDKKLNVLNSQ